MVDDDGFDDFIDMRLAGYRVLPIRDVHEGGPEADGQVVGIHHVLITVLGEARREQVRTGPHCPPKRQIFPQSFFLGGRGGGEEGKVGMQLKCRSFYILIYNNNIDKSLGTALPEEASHRGLPRPGTH